MRGREGGGGGRVCGGRLCMSQTQEFLNSTLDQLLDTFIAEYQACPSSSSPQSCFGAYCRFFARFRAFGSMSRLPRPQFLSQLTRFPKSSQNRKQNEY